MTITDIIRPLSPTSSSTTSSDSDEEWEDFSPPRISRASLIGARPLAFGEQFSFAISPNNNTDDDEDKLSPLVWGNSSSTQPSREVISDEQWNRILAIAGIPSQSQVSNGQPVEQNHEMYASFDDHDPNGTAVSSMLQYAHSMAVVSAMYDPRSRMVSLNQAAPYSERRTRTRNGANLRVNITHSAGNLYWEAASASSMPDSAATRLPSPKPHSADHHGLYKSWLSSLPTSLPEFLSHLDTYEQASTFAGCFQNKLAEIQDVALDTDGVFVGNAAMEEDVAALTEAIDQLRGFAPVGR